MTLNFSQQLRLFILSLFILSVFNSCNYEQEMHEKMITNLNDIYKLNYKKENPFCPEPELAFFDSLSKVEGMDPYKMLKVNYYKANSYLKAGQELKSVALLEKLATESISNYRSDIYPIMVSLGIANLRLAERQNCVLNHTAESCILPIMNSGVHKIKMGSRRAIDVYATILKRFQEDYESKWLLNMAYMTLGEYPAGVPDELLIKGLDKDNSGVSIKAFEDIAPNLGLNIKNKAGGVIVDDFNNDSFDDIVVSDWDLNGSMHFFLNNGNGTFSDVSKKSSLGRFKGGLNMIQGDYNNDGLVDIFVLRGAWMPEEYGEQPNSLLRNNGDGTFTDVTIKSGMYSLHPTQAGVWRDFNNDGWLDLFIGNETQVSNFKKTHGCELYINNHDGTFKNVAVEANVNINAFIKGVASADYNNDGWQDLFLSTMNGYKVLLKNKGLKNGKLTFENVSELSGVKNIRVSTFPTWFFDYDNDGWQDIFVCGYQFDKSLTYSTATDHLGITNKASKMYLYKNNKDGTFKDVSVEMGLNHSVFAMGSNFGDIDNDGYLDFYLGTGNPDYTSLVPNKLYKNMGGKKFADVTISGRVGNLQKGHAVSCVDLNNDGSQDIFVEVGGAYTGDAYNNSLYLNPIQNNNNWIKILLEGVASNRSAIGSKIKVRFTENGVKRVVYRELNSGGSFGSSPLRREIGIGQAKVIDEIAITWSKTRKTEVFKNIRPNQLLKIKEGQNKFVAVKVKRQLLGGINSNGAVICETPKVL